MSSNRLLVTIVDMDKPFTQIWYLRDTPELWQFLNKHGKMGGGHTPRFPSNLEVTGLKELGLTVAMEAWYKYQTLDSEDTPEERASFARECMTNARLNKKTLHEYMMSRNRIFGAATL